MSRYRINNRFDQSWIAVGSTGRNVRLWMWWGGGGNRLVRLKLVPGQTYRLYRKNGNDDDGWFWIMEFLSYDGVEVRLKRIAQYWQSGGGYYSGDEALMGPEPRLYYLTEHDGHRGESVLMPDWIVQDRLSRDLSGDTEGCY